jgi:integrase
MAQVKHQGKWRYEFLKDGIRHRKSGFPSKTEAMLAEAKAREQIGKINSDFLRLCNSRLEEVEIHRSKNYFIQNKKTIEVLIARWATYETITRPDIEAYLNEIAKKSRHNANLKLRMIRALFNHGIERDWFMVNPCKGIHLFSVSKEKKYVPPLDCVIRVLAIANPIDKAYLLMIIHTLGRIREVNGLKWKDVTDTHLILKTRKARNSDEVSREIPLNATLKEVISGLDRSKEYVFTNPRTGDKYDYRDKFLKTLCKVAGVKEFTYHNLRHFGASMLANSGQGITTIQAILGHARATTTDIYLQNLAGSAEEALRALEGVK